MLIYNPTVEKTESEIPPYSPLEPQYVSDITRCSRPMSLSATSKISANERDMGTDTAETTEPEGKETEKRNMDAFRSLAEAYAQIEYVEKQTKGHGPKLDDAKTAICEVQDSIFDAEVNRALQEMEAEDGIESGKY